MLKGMIEEFAKMDADAEAAEIAAALEAANEEADAKRREKEQAIYWKKQRKEADQRAADRWVVVVNSYVCMYLHSLVFVFVIRFLVSSCSSCFCSCSVGLRLSPRFFCCFSFSPHSIYSSVHSIKVYS